VGERLFHDTYRLNPAEFGEILEALEVSTTMMYPNRGAMFTWTTGMLVWLARLRTARALHSLGRKLRMNPDRISKIYVTMLRWMRQRWGATVVCGLDISRLPIYVEAIKTRTAVNVLVFGFIDCTLKSTRRVKYGHTAVYSGHKKKHDLKYQIVAVRPGELTCCLAGPVQGPRGDNMILEESELEDYVQGIQRSLPHIC
jgi:hypothetical protein